MHVQDALKYVQANRPRFVAELKEFIRFPSVSAQPAHAADVRRCGEWLAKHMKRIGLQRVVVIPTRRHPIVYGEWEHATGRPTVLIYGHFDVQPADPLDQWRSPPFDPQVRGNNLYGRGACDDKGQLFVHLKAIESFLRTTRRLPVNVLCLFEGEEEIGSPNLNAFLERNAAALRAHVAVMSDTRMLGPHRPAINYAERGALSVEMEVTGPRFDLHSGNFGGAVHNPLQVLSEILSRLHDSAGHVAIPGFYDRVLPATKLERAYMARTGPSDAEILRDAQAQEAWGEPEYSLYERITLRPALTINGITGGYQGPGGKSVIPSHAVAKLNFRLVPDQDPAEVDQLFRQYIRRITPPTAKLVVRSEPGAKSALVNPGHPAIQMAAQAYRKGFGSAPVFLRSGGTIPIVNSFQKILGLPTVLMGFALPDDRMHAPNEKFHLPNFYRGIATSIWFMQMIAAARIGKLRQVRRAWTSLQPQAEATGETDDY
jgi:acetylornithine deacetylase/succinyl-diaminopimelate desuccinylase-like protein